MAGINSKSIFKLASGSDIIKIISLTSLVFVILQFTRVTYLISNEPDTFFIEKIYHKLALPATFRELWKQPWSVLTYMFADIGFMRVLGNMIWLWVFGTVIEDLKGSYRIFPLYLTGGIMGGIALVGAQSAGLLPVINHYTGALAPLLTIAFATLMYRPSYRFTMLGSLSIPIWVFIVIFIALHSLTLKVYSFSLLCLAVSSILFGLAYTHVLHGYYESFTLALKRFSNYFSNNDNFILEKSERERKRNFNTFQRRKKDLTSIDDILDKINEKGMRSLSKEERKLLEEFSRHE